MIYWSQRGRSNVNRIIISDSERRSYPKVKVITGTTEHNRFVRKEAKSVTIEEQVVNLLTNKARSRISGSITNQPIFPGHRSKRERTVGLPHKLVRHSQRVKFILDTRSSSFFPDTRAVSSCAIRYKLDVHIVYVNVCTIDNLNYITILALNRKVSNSRSGILEDKQSVF